MLEFEAKCGGAPDALTIQGADFITLDERGKIKHFGVLARPPNAVMALAEHQAKFIGPELLGVAPPGSAKTKPRAKM